jgi:hypothetical protein
MMYRYHVTIDGGQGGETFLWEETAADALKAAIAWAQGGDWTYPAAFRVTVMNEDDPTDTATVVVEMHEPQD